jgi:preprotein translocase subunit SecB
MSVAPPDAAPLPPLTVHAQYVKDLSFENPRSPHSLMEQGQPQLGLNVLVKTRQLEGTTYEVALVVEADAKTEKGEVVFLLELIYGGVFTLGEIPQEAVGPMLLIECPRLLFPFARAVVANTTREAGFPPLQIAPVDFATLYRQQLEQAGQQVGTA